MDFLKEVPMKLQAAGLPAGVANFIGNPVTVTIIFSLLAFGIVFALTRPGEEHKVPVAAAVESAPSVTPVADVAEAPVAPAAPVNKKDDDAAAEAPASPPRTARKHREKSPAREPASATGWRKSVRSRNTPDRFPGTIMM